MPKDSVDVMLFVFLWVSGRAQTEGKGLHSDKEFPPSKVTDVSEVSP